LKNSNSNNYKHNKLGNCYVKLDCSASEPLNHSAWQRVSLAKMETYILLIHYFFSGDGDEDPEYKPARITFDIDIGVKNLVFRF